MDTLKWMQGYVSVSVTSADITGLLRRINAAGITAYQLRQTGDLTLQFSIRRQDLRSVRKILGKSGDSLHLESREGLYWLMKGMMRRPVMLCGILALLLLTALLPRRIYFVQVEGNQVVPTAKIVEAAENCGIKFGAVRQSVRSEKMKNAILAAIPELQWAGVNTSGCLAILSVKERTQPDHARSAPKVSSILAARDGVITEVTVKNGTPLCKVGQGVTAGQVLISGYTDCGICIRATQSEGEIYALTKRQLDVITPLEVGIIGAATDTGKKISVIFGKKRINFSKGSGISDATCGKMYQEYTLTLPGGFALPVRIVVERWTTYDLQSQVINEENARAKNSQFAKDYLQSQMIAGTVQSVQENMDYYKGGYFSEGNYVCHEMIGITRFEENIDEIDREDRERRTG